jgi:MFS family permease
VHVLNGKIRKGTILIIIIGFVSLFGDFTYEGARSIIPQYFTSLGGSVFLLGIVLGVSEFAGYAFRLVSGKIADRTKRYWPMMFVGYAINLFAVPLLALAGNYIGAAVLIFLERLGKGTRTPPRDYVISSAAAEGKTGKAFAIEEGLDQAGAIVGPLVVAMVLLYRGTYKEAFAFLAFPAVSAMVVLFAAYRYYGRANLKRHKEMHTSIMSSRKFLMYSVAVAISAAGLYQVAFVLYGAQGRIAAYLIPIIFLTAMAGEGAFGFAFGLLYDRIGRKLVYSGLMVSLLIPIILLGGTPEYLFIAALAYGAVLGIQDTVMRAVVGSMIKHKERGSAFGIFNAFYGFGLLASGAIVGYLYFSIDAVIAYVFVAQAIAFVLLSASFTEK